MNNKNHNRRGGHECQAPHSIEVESSDATGALWNSPLGRRAFLKRTGAATVATAVAMHGLMMQVQATGTGNKVLSISDTWTATDNFVLTFSLGDGGAAGTANKTNPSEGLNQEIANAIQEWMDRNKPEVSWVSGTEGTFPPNTRLKNAIPVANGGEGPYLTHNATILAGSLSVAYDATTDSWKCSCEIKAGTITVQYEHNENPILVNNKGSKASSTP